MSATSDTFSYSYKRGSIAFLALFALVSALFVVPAAFADNDPVQPDDEVGHISGPSPDGTNHPAFWVNYGSDNFDETWVCQDVNESDEDANYTLDRQPDEDHVWRALIVKQATTNYVFLDPQVDATFDTGGAYSHLILCQMELVGTQEPETQQIVFHKSWVDIDGQPFEFDDEVTVTFDVKIDGVEVTLDDGQASDPFDINADWEFIGENVTGFPEDDCTYEGAVGSGIIDLDGVLSFGVSNTVECDGGDDDVDENDVDQGVLPVQLDADDEEDDVEEAVLPAAIDAGTGGLANSGMPAFILALMALGALMLGSGAVAARKRI